MENEAFWTSKTIRHQTYDSYVQNMTSCVIIMTSYVIIMTSLHTDITVFLSLVESCHYYAEPKNYGL